jgi:multidrug efflux pump subunit AcrB
MKSIASWFAQNPVASNLLMMFLIVGGLASLLRMKVELFPEFSLDVVNVQVIYPGASPEEVEESVCIPIEEEIQGLEGIKEIRSTSIEGSGTVSVEILPGEDVRRVLDDVKTRVDAIDTFPELAEKPIITDLVMRTQVINVAIFGNADEVTLKRLSERVRDDLSALEGISQVQLAGTRPYEISIEVSESALRRWGLSFDDVANAVRGSSLDLSGGSVKTSGGEILLRTPGKAYIGEEFEEIVVLARNDGSRILLRDVAEVVDGFEDTDQSARFNGYPAAMVQVFRVGNESALDVSTIVHEYLARTRPTLPEGISIEPWQDAAVYLQGRLDLLLKNGAQGLLLVFLLLAVFLKFRLAFWVTLGIPISFLGTLIVMPPTDQSLNMLSVFAFILVLGIVVDDAIVVGENVHREHQRGTAGVGGAVKGVVGVAVPVIFAVLTTIVAFLPMVALPGVTGKFFGIIPMVVIPALFFSLVESQWILPSHLAHQSERLGRLGHVFPFKYWTAFQETFANGFDRFRDSVYKPLLRRAVEWRYVTVATAVAALLATFGIVGGGFVNFVFFPEIESDVLAAQITMPEGTSVDVTKRAIAQLERAAQEMIVGIDGEGQEGEEGEATPVFSHMMSAIGEQPYATQKGNYRGGGGIVGAQYGEVVIELTPAENREFTALELASRWREVAGPVPGAVDVNYDASLMDAGSPISVKFTGHDVESLRSAGDELKAVLASYQGVIDITDSFRGGKLELALDIRPEAEALGLTRNDLALQVRQGFYGEEAQRIQRGRDEVKVMVRYPDRDRRSLYGVESMRVRTQSGAEVPFSTVADAELRRGYATIERTDRRRTIQVSADVDVTQANANIVMKKLEADVLPGILARHPGVNYMLEGQSSEQAEMRSSLGMMFLMAMVAIFGLMAIPFRSYLQPAIVMTAIPFGLIGAILGHALLGVDLSMLSVLGIVALAGVVVNDSLVMVDFVNRERDAGNSVEEAALSAGVTRFRAIILTSLTTFVGLMPLILERSVQAQFLVPMGVSLAFGVLFSTGISLLLVPACYVILEDLRRGGAWLMQGSGASEPGTPVEGGSGA